MYELEGRKSLDQIQLTTFSAFSSISWFETEFAQFSSQWNVILYVIIFTFMCVEIVKYSLLMKH